MLEGGGRTPILTPLELEALGYKIVSYPLSLIGVSISAMQVCCSSLCSESCESSTFEFMMNSQMFYDMG